MRKKKVWRFDGYLKSHIRQIWRWSPKRRECLKASQCLLCGLRKRKLFADHIFPVIDPQKGFQGWDTYISRMFDGTLQPLCEKCHKAKSKEENKQRRLAKKRVNDS